MHPAAEPTSNLAALYLKNRSRAIAVAERILQDRDDAEDVIQEVFARLFFQEDSFEGRSAYSTWLYRIVVNSSINFLRGRRRRTRLYASPSEPLSPEEFAAGREVERQIISALAKISERQRQVFFLREMRGLSYPDIAQLLGIPEGTVKSALNRAREKVCALIPPSLRPSPPRTDPSSRGKGR